MSLLQKDMTGMVEAVQAADSGSFAAAARVLNLSAAAVSKNVATLESRLGTRLFNRTTRHLSVTEEGRRYLLRIREGLAHLSDADASAQAGSEPQGLVRISCGVSFGQRFVLPLLGALFEQYPNLRIELSLSDAQIDVVRDGFDFGIRGGADPPEGMVARRISRISTVLVASPNYLRESGVPATWKELDQHKIIEVRFQSSGVWPWMFRDGRQTVTLATRGALILSDPATVVDAALQDLGIGQVTVQHAWAQIQAGSLLRVLEQFHVSNTIDLAIYYPHRRGLALRVRVVMEFLLNKLSRHPALATMTHAKNATLHRDT